MNKPLPQQWDLEVFFPGGSDSEAFQAYVAEIKKDTESLQSEVNSFTIPISAENQQAFLSIVAKIQSIGVRMREAGAFVGCLTAQNMKDKKALLLGGQMKMVMAGFQAILTQLESLFSQIEENVWQGLMEIEDIKRIAFNLTEIRQKAQDKLPPEQEILINDLAIDGYHGWSELYNTTVSQMSIPYEENGETKQLSVGQAFNKLSDNNKAVRDEMFQRWEDTWANYADFCAEALNHLAGFRLNMYKHRGWDNIHKEPLNFNRMSEETLTTMWDTIEKNKPAFVDYFKRKAELLGVDQLSWVDVDAPIGSTTTLVGYDDAADFIVEQFQKFSPKMADFTVKAFEKAWIEAEDRPGKRPGGFCTSFPDSKQTRIFMTYSGTASNISTLAHELGHAYHQHVMQDLPPLAQQYAMGVAETASTFAEMIVADAAVKAAQTKEEKIVLLEDKIQRSTAFYMNIHARFIFETNFYKERAKGLVSVDRLNTLMEEAQKAAYKDSLKGYHPLFWASKMHFYMTRVPFYNFPYTFGYLFSAGIYARAIEEGTAFEDKYIALLEDTASMSVEDLAQKHLGVDLTQPEFWQKAIDLSLEDVKEFLELTK